jgi:hypothetical protein
MPETPASTQTPLQPKDAAAAPPELTIDVLNDLDSTSALVKLLTDNRSTLFSIASQVAQFKNQNISVAATANASAQLKLNADNSWTIPNTGITLSLTAAATGTISISKASDSIAVTTTIDSDNTTNILATPPTGTTVYVNIGLSFSIKGTAAAGGNINAVGIAGTVSDGHTATISLCQPVDGGVNTLAAIKQAFSQIVFPLDPARITNMQTGALARVVFDGTLSAELDVTYGLGNHTFAAPGVASALASAQNVVSLTAPSLNIDAGITGSVSYSHTDHYALIINKSKADMATVYLVRALEDDLGGSVGINVGVKATNISVAVNQAGLQSLVQNVTGTSTLATSVATLATQPANNLVSSLNAKLASWATDINGDIGLTASLARQKNRATLFVFDADLSNANLSQQAWPALLSGNILNALNAGGLTLQPGSGVSESLKRSATIHFQFFNLFFFTSLRSFFSTATAVLAPDGNIRLAAAIGDETDQNTKKALSSFRTYFVVGATENPAGGITHTDVDFRIELSETGKTQKGASYVDTLSLVPNPKPPAVAAAQQAIGQFLGARPQNKVTLIYDVKASAYSRLTFSPFTAGKPGPLPHPEDEANWNAFHGAAVNLPPKLAFVAPVTFEDWVKFNEASIDQVGSKVDPDRHHTGNPANGLHTLDGNPDALSISFFLRASQSFMNLCEDIRSLAEMAPGTNDLAQYNDLLTFIKNIVTNPALSDYAIPTAGALLQQLSVGGTTFVNTIELPTDNSSITCTLTLS